MPHSTSIPPAVPQIPNPWWFPDLQLLDQAGFKVRQIRDCLPLKEQRVAGKANLHMWNILFSSHDFLPIKTGKSDKSYSFNNLLSTWEINRKEQQKSSLAWSRKEAEGHEAPHTASLSGQHHTSKKKRRAFRGSYPVSESRKMVGSGSPSWRSHRFQCVLYYHYWTSVSLHWVLSTTSGGEPHNYCRRSQCSHKDTFSHIKLGLCLFYQDVFDECPR